MYTAGLTIVGINRTSFSGSIHVLYTMNADTPDVPDDTTTAYAPTLPAGLPVDVWREIADHMFAPDVDMCRGLYRVMQTCRALQRVCKERIYVMKSKRPLLTAINPTEYISAEIYLGGAPEAYIDDKMILSEMVVHFEWFRARDLSVSMWRAIAGMAATDVVSLSIDMHYHEQKSHAITTIVAVRGVGCAESLSFGFTSNTEGGFTMVTLKTSDVISMSHELNPISRYVEITSHSDLVSKNTVLLDDRTMNEKIISLFQSVMSAEDRAIINRCTISAGLSVEFDALGMTTDEDFLKMMRIIDDISADNGVLPHHSFIALLRDKPWIMNR